MRRFDFDSQSGQRSREVLDAQTELVCRYLPDTTLTFVNASFCARFERSPEELLGHRLTELVPREQREPLLAHVRSVVAQGAGSTLQALHRPSGSPAYIEWSDRVIADPNGRLVELQRVGRDVTLLVRVKRELADLRAQLTHLARVAMLGQLSGAFAHELRQPLTSILSNAQAAQRLVRQQPIDAEELGDILTDIVADDVRMGQVIARLGSLLKKRDLEVQPITIDTIVLTALELARVKLAEGGVAVHTELAQDLPMVRGDAVQLGQVVLNFLLNAVDAMSANDPANRHVTVKAACPGPDTVAVTVTDNGAGISRAAAAHLFQPFNTTKANGLGLGLSISRAIIEAHGGMISAHPCRPRGTEFEFTLPVADSADAIEAADRPAEREGRRG